MQTGKADGHVLVYVTASSPAEARHIARQLVEERLVACANVTAPVHSFYWWEGAVQEAQEMVLFAKTLRQQVEAVVQRVKELHGYDVPAVVALDIVAGNPDYLTWIDQECLVEK